MVIENSSGFIGAFTMFGGLGGLVVLASYAIPLFGWIAGTLTLTAGVHAWATKRG